MEKNPNYNGYNNFYNYPPFNQFDNFDPNLADNAFDPMYQYEQGYMYYRYLTQAMEYKIKCKEYDKLNGKDLNVDRRVN